LFRQLDFTLLPIVSVVIAAEVSNLPQLTSETLRQPSGTIMTSQSDDVIIYEQKRYQIYEKSRH